MKRLRRVVTVSALGLVVGVAVAFAVGAGSSDHGYLVRAIFDNASFIIPGENVKIGGVDVGTVKAVELTGDNKAAAVLRITDPAYRPFRSDAQCDIRLQSLIGEQYVECTPTRARVTGAREPAELAAVPRGPHRGQHLLGVAHTSSPVGVDLLNNIMRLPEQQRFQIIIAELGAGLAGNGTELRAALRRADPALVQTERVVGVLASQNTILADLTDESDRDLAPLAKQRASVGGFIDHAGAVGVATADRGDALEANFAKLPAFLAQLTPAAKRFSALADQMTPGLQSLQAQAPAINEAVKELGSFSTAAGPALTTLGKVADRGRQAFPAANATAKRLDALATPLRSVAQNIAAVASTFDQRGGIESVMRFIYYYTGALNGEDKLGHYVRTLADISNCTRSSTLTCPSNFDLTGEAYKHPSTTALSTDAAGPASELLQYLLGGAKDGKK